MPFAIDISQRGHVLSQNSGWERVRKRERADFAYLPQQTYLKLGTVYPPSFPHKCYVLYNAAVCHAMCIFVSKSPLGLS